MSENLPSSYRLGYRADIEGLRAVAILLVVAAHAGVPWLAGGYVGVDVFFVLSGYLITGLLVDEIDRTNDLRFASFYVRRLRRLLPALFLMLLGAGLLCWLLVPVTDQSLQADAAGNAAVWLSNLFFAFTHTGYFTPSAQHNLFLHTWSLGVEEQFYLLWPLLVVIVAGAWRGARRPPRTVRLKLVMPVVFAASLALCLFWSDRSPRLAFYMMPSRAWQFALGALVFLYFGMRKRQIDPAVPETGRSRAAAAAAGWGGLGMILFSAVLLTRHVTYPGGWALLPSFGAALTLVSGAYAPGLGVGSLLSLKPMQATGRVSYSWYLWHWPILALGADLPDLGGPFARLVLVALSLLIAVASYRLVERPIRRIRLVMARPRIGVAVAAGVMGLAFVAAARWQALEGAGLSSAVQKLVAARWDAPAIYSEGCDDWYHGARVKPCAFGPRNAKHTVVVIGDSIAMQWLPAIRKVFAKRQWRVVAITKSACPMVDAPIFYTRIDRIYAVCSTWRAHALKAIGKIDPDVVIFSSYAGYAFSKAQWIGGTREVLRELSAAAKRVYLIRGTPILAFDGAECLEPHSAAYRWLAGDRRCESAADNAHFDEIYRWLRAAAAPFANVHTIDMTRYVCPGGECRAKLDGSVVFRDDAHLTATFAKSLAPDLASRLFRAGTNPS